MTTAEGGEGTSSRTRDAGASKQALLEAAQKLFGQKGFERTTTREIGESAGVDAALIARYFGGKADLYVAAMAAERMDEGQPVDFETLEQIVDALVTRTDKHGPGPILQALIRSDTSDEIRTAARSRLQLRLVEPLALDMADSDVDRHQLRAEIAVSAVIGISLSRSLGWFDHLSSVPRLELIELVSALIGGMTET